MPQARTKANSKAPSTTKKESKRTAATPPTSLLLWAAIEQTAADKPSNSTKAASTAKPASTKKPKRATPTKPKTTAKTSNRAKQTLPTPQTKKTRPTTKTKSRRTTPGLGNVLDLRARLRDSRLDDFDRLSPAALTDSRDLSLGEPPAANETSSIPSAGGEQQQRTTTPAEPTGEATELGDDVTSTPIIPDTDAMVSLWERHRDESLEQAMLLEDVAAAAFRQGLDEGLRAEGERAAHKLAGSLGTFGMQEGTRLARTIESALGEERIDALQLASSVVTLRDEIARARPEALLLMAEGSTRQADEDRQAIRALVVSADIDLTTGISLAALTANVTVYAARDGDAATEALGDGNWDIVLVDLAASHRDSILAETAQQHGDVLIVAIGEQDSFDQRVQAATLGARGFLLRSNTPRQMLSAISRLRTVRESDAARALVIEPEHSIRDLLPAVLGEHELQVANFDNSQELWSALESEGGDILIVDLEASPADGIALCRVVRADPRFQRLPILALTARDDVDAMGAAFDAGADDYVAKPVVVPELLSRVRTQIERGSLIHVLSEIDSLTGLENRWRCEQTLSKLLRLAERQDKPLCIGIVNLDRFKQLNNRWGHAAGDDVLRRFGQLCHKSFRDEDVVGRWGGDEFVIAMYDAEATDCMERLGELLEAFRSEDFATEGGQEFRASFSAGVAQFPDDGGDLETLYNAADEALAGAKVARGRVSTTSRTHVETDTVTTEYRDVVVIEDDEPLANLLVHALETRGYDVAQLADGEEAARQLGSGKLRASLVLLDIGLPGLDGFGVLRRLRDRGVLEKTQVVVLTVRSSEEETLRALELGATDLVPKPFSVPVLMRRVHHLLELRE